MKPSSASSAAFRTKTMNKVKYILVWSVVAVVFAAIFSLCLVAAFSLSAPDADVIGFGMAAVVLFSLAVLSFGRALDHALDMFEDVA